MEDVSRVRDDGAKGVSSASPAEQNAQAARKASLILALIDEGASSCQALVFPNQTLLALVQSIIGGRKIDEYLERAWEASFEHAHEIEIRGMSHRHFLRLERLKSACEAFESLSNLCFLSNSSMFEDLLETYGRGAYRSELQLFVETDDEESGSEG